MIEEKETTIDYDAILGDFDGFLKERNWEGCNAVIDNLRDLGEYQKGIELAKRLTARKMTVPADYDKCDCPHNSCVAHAKWNEAPADYGEEPRQTLGNILADEQYGVW